MIGGSAAPPAVTTSAYGAPRCSGETPGRSFRLRWDTAMTRRDRILLVAYGLGIAIFMAAVLVWSITAG